MANKKQLEIFREGNDAWLKWRSENQDIKADLSATSLDNNYLHKANLRGVDLNRTSFIEADLSEADLSEADLRGADLRGANLKGAKLRGADLSEADLSETDLFDVDLSNAKLNKTNLYWAFLSGSNLSRANLKGVTLRKAKLLGTNLKYANLREANISDADLSGANLNGVMLRDASLIGSVLHGTDLSWAELVRANLNGADLKRANLSWADLSEATLKGAKLHEVALYNATLVGADLSGANLTGALLVGADLEGANLSGCHIFGVSAWKLKLDNAVQSDLIITDEGETVITVDNLEIAQFIYLLIHNEQLHNVIDTMGKQCVLILGRFTPERKAVLDALRESLRRQKYIPILFDFEKPTSRDLTETIVTLAHLSRFVIADLTDPSSLPHELMSFVPELPSVAIQPIILKGHRPYAMFEHLQRYPWVLPIHEYETQEQLVAQLLYKVIQPAQAKADEIRPIS